MGRPSHPRSGLAGATYDSAYDIDEAGTTIIGESSLPNFEQHAWVNDGATTRSWSGSGVTTRSPASSMGQD